MFVGPNKHFSIVIDEFDGKIVKAWHIENSKGEKSSNLAPPAVHIDPWSVRPAAPRPTSSAVSIPPCMTKPERHGSSQPHRPPDPSLRHTDRAAFSEKGRRLTWERF
ncbi:MAG: hypothetical protein ACLSHC_09790 [Bilophila wadsworthia]